MSRLDLAGAILQQVLNNEKSSLRISIVDGGDSGGGSVTPAQVKATGGRCVIRDLAEDGTVTEKLFISQEGTRQRSVRVARI